MEDGENKSIIDGPEPSRWAALLSAARASLAALRARKAAAPTPAAVKPGKAARTAATPAADPEAATLEANNLKAWRDVHGAPAIWMAPFFLAFAAAFGLPLAARYMSPEAPREMIHQLVGHLPAVAAAPLEPMIAGWLWAPWWLALLALAFRLRAAWVARLAVMDAVGWGMSALALEGVAWMGMGRKAMLDGFSPAEQDGAWQLLLLEFLFLLLTATLFGPTSRYRALPRRT